MDKRRFSLRDRASWVSLYPSLNKRPDVLERLVAVKNNRCQLDVLHDAGLLNVLPSTDVLFVSGQGFDMFFVADIMTEEEGREMSFLQGMLLLFNLLIPQGEWFNGWNLLPIGMHKKYKKAPREWAMAKALKEEGRVVLKCLLPAFQVLDKRLQWWATTIGKKPHIFKEQKKMCKAWKAKLPPSQLNVPLDLDLSTQMYLSMGQRTGLHRDDNDLGLSPVYYYGFDWPGRDDECGDEDEESDLGGSIGIPEKKIIWNQKPNSAIAIRGNRFWYSSRKVRIGFLRMIAAGFVPILTEK